MSSSDDTSIKTKAAEIYKKIMGDDEKPNYAKFMSYAFKHDEKLVMEWLHKNELFESKEETLKLLENHVEMQSIIDGLVQGKPTKATKKDVKVIPELPKR